MRTSRSATILAIGLPSGAIAALGLVHPHQLTFASAPWWVGIHLLLLPLFPLLGVDIWILLRGETSFLATIARIAAFLFMPLYTALDAIDGIAAGTIRLSQSSGRVPGSVPLGDLFARGNQLGDLGCWSLLVAVVLALAVLAVRHPRWSMFVPGAALLIAGSYLFRGNHIYWPVGGLSVLALGAGAILVALSRAATPVSPIRSA